MLFMPLPGGIADIVSVSLMMLSELSLLLKLLQALLSFRGKSRGLENALPDKRMIAILI